MSKHILEKAIVSKDRKILEEIEDLIENDPDLIVFCREEILKYDQNYLLKKVIISTFGEEGEISKKSDLLSNRWNSEIVQCSVYGLEIYGNIVGILYYKVQM